MYAQQQSSVTDDPLVPWTELCKEVRGPAGKPCSLMTLHRWRKAGLIDVTQINNRNYLRMRATLTKLEGSAA